MRTYTTTIWALDNITGYLTTFAGPPIMAPSRDLAIQWCQNNAGYLHVGDELVCEVPCRIGTHKPDMEGLINYDLSQLN